VRGLAEYEAVAQNTPDILHFYKTGARNFPTSAEIASAERPGLQRSLLFYNWKPSSRYTWRQTADGAADAEIATIAAGIKAYPHKLFLTIYHEPEDNVNPSAGSGMQPQDYAAMYRRVVDKLREAGVSNAVLVWNVMGYSGWRQYYDALYPGDSYVDWVAYDPYARNNVFDDLVDLVNRGRPELGWPGFYSWATSKAPGKPIMWAEWGVDLITNRNPTAMISIDPNVIADRYPKLKAIVYWHQLGVGNYRLDDNNGLGRSFGTAFRQLANDQVFNAMTPNGAP